MKYILVLLIFFNSQIFAAEDMTFELIDEEAGIVEDPYSIENDTFSFALLGHMGAEPDNFAKLYIMEAAFSIKLDSVWIETIVGQVNGDFKSMFGTQNSTIDSTSPAEAKETMLSAGFGLGYRFNYIQELFGSKKWYDTTKAYLTYNVLDEQYSGESFQGLGIRGDYTVQYRFSPSNYSGIRASYHVASLKRSEMENETSSSERALTYSVFSLAFEYGFYF